MIQINVLEVQWVLLIVSGHRSLIQHAELQATRKLCIVDVVYNLTVSLWDRHPIECHSLNRKAHIALAVPSLVGQDRRRPHLNQAKDDSSIGELEAILHLGRLCGYIGSTHQYE